MAAQKRHLTAEQLSAYLDRHLSDEEQATCERHLHTCQHCQQVLAALQETVELLHALPQPSLPRSFVLSEEMLATTTSATAAASPLPIASRRRRPSLTLNVLRTLTALAAVLGIVFLLSSLSALSFQFEEASSPRAGSAAMPASGSQATKPNVTGHGTEVLKPNQEHLSPSASQASTPGPATPTPQATAGQKSTQSATQSPIIPLPDLSSAGTRAWLGLFLLLIALLAFLLLRRQSQKTRAG